MLPFSSALSLSYPFLLPVLPPLLKLIVMGLPRTTPFWASSRFLADSGLLESHSSLITINFCYCSGYPVKQSLNSHYLCCSQWASVNGSWSADPGCTFLAFWLTACHLPSLPGNHWQRNTSLLLRAISVKNTKYHSLSSSERIHLLGRRKGVVTNVRN